MSRPRSADRHPLDFSGFDEDASEAAVEDLADRFADWLDRGGWSGPATVDDAALLLDWRWRRGDPHLGRWERDHIDWLLLEALPASYSAAPEQLDTIPSTVAALIAFLEVEGLLDTSAGADELIARATALQRSFRDAMEDVERFGTTKRIFAAMGVDPATDLTQVDVDDVMARFNALSYEERGEILGLDDDHSGPGPAHSARPAVPLPMRDLPTPEAMDALAADVTVLAHVDALWAAMGPDPVRLTDTGQLKLADGRRLVEALGLDDPIDLVRSTADLPRLFGVVEVARMAGAARADERRLWRVPDWPDRPAGDRWGAVADGVLAVGAATWAHGSRESWISELTEAADSAAVYLLAVLWMSEEPLPASTLGDMLVDGIDHGMLDPGTFDLGRDHIERWLRDEGERALRSLVDLGLVAVEDEHLHLTRGGARIAVPWLREVGFAATTPEDIVDLDAVAFLDRLADEDELPEDVATAWLAGGEGREAALVAAAIDRPEPARVLCALATLDGRGEEAIAAVRTARDSVIGPNATLWLIEQGELEPDELPPELGREAGVMTMLALLDTGSAVDVIETILGGLPVEEHRAMFEHLAGAENPRTAELLEQVGRHHPDKPTGKHLRKLAHRWRSAHGSAR